MVTVAGLREVVGNGLSAHHFVARQGKRTVFSKGGRYALRCLHVNSDEVFMRCIQALLYWVCVHPWGPGGCEKRQGIEPPLHHEERFLRSISANTKTTPATMSQTAAWSTMARPGSVTPLWCAFAARGTQARINAASFDFKSVFMEMSVLVVDLGCGFRLGYFQTTPGFANTPT